MILLKRFIENPYRIFNVLNKWRLLDWMPDEWYLKVIYRARLGKRLDLKNPTTFNEKIQWMKLYNRNQQHSYMTDKYLVKKYIAEIIGEKHLIPTVGIWERFDDIDFDNMPNQFVLKCTHDSGNVVVCRDKDGFDKTKMRKVFKRALKRNYYKEGREISYKDIKPRIIAEPYVQDETFVNLTVYKIMCFGGEPKIIKVIRDDHEKNQTVDFMNTEWKRLDIKQDFPNGNLPLKKPETLEEMLAIARKIAEGYTYLRVDLYEINKEVYFSEISFFSDSGFAPFYPQEWDEKLGAEIKLMLEKKENNVEK